MTTDNQNLLRRIADYERISGILWIVLGVLQLCSIVGAIAGIWNIIAGVSRFKLVPRIRAADATVPGEYQDITQLVIIAAINLFLGGIIGIACVVFDFYIRDKVLSNAGIFTGAAPAPANPNPSPDRQGGDVPVQRTGTTEQQLRMFAQLRTDNLITDDEFACKKQELLGL